MTDSHVLISLDARHAENILAGRKSVELRRRSMRLPPGTTVWLYVKVPIGAVIGRASVAASHVLTPSLLWKSFAQVSGLSRKEFFQYFEGVSKGCALILENVERLPESISLKALRRAVKGFQPPQFFIRLYSDTGILKLISSPRSEALGVARRR